jgi:uncharacterized RmlC-like cupin family protein
MLNHHDHAELMRLRDAAYKEALRLRHEAMESFWHGADAIASSAATRTLRSAQRLLYSLQRSGKMTSLSCSQERRMPIDPASTADAITAIRPAPDALATRQGLPYFVGISGQSAGSQGLSMHLVVIPPGARSEPHLHEGHETAIYVLQGRVETLYGHALAQSVVSEPGDFLFIPPGVPHVAVNLSDTEPARAVVARNDAAEQDKVRPYALPT